MILEKVLREEKQAETDATSKVRTYLRNYMIFKNSFLTYIKFNYALCLFVYTYIHLLIYIS